MASLEAGEQKSPQFPVTGKIFRLLNKNIALNRPASIKDTKASHIKTAGNFNLSGS